MAIDSYLKSVCDPVVVNRVIADRASTSNRLRAEQALRNGVKQLARRNLHRGNNVHRGDNLLCGDHLQLPTGQALHKYLFDLGAVTGPPIDTTDEWMKFTKVME